ncbi:hypothetical protein DESPIGER_1306 [Desulfovibrio piger]|uniref:Uncharacterized protein n=1 Tax=Desulfovibrio piger TaxID=901 RepID=A0A1K1LEJ0_9BACT|nr:hypothetical protein DESPIGER_1306 [Desulfovibrio piger]
MSRGRTCRETLPGSVAYHAEKQIPSCLRGGRPRCPAGRRPFFPGRWPGETEAGGTMPSPCFTPGDGHPGKSRAFPIRFHPPGKSALGEGWGALPPVSAAQRPLCHAGRV